MGASGSKSRDLEARVARLEAENEQLRFTVKHGGQGYDYAPRPGATTLDGLLGRVNHIARIVADAEASRKFYVDVLGAKLLNRPYIPGAGFWLWLGNIQLHLIEAPHAAVAAEAQHADNVATGVANHLSFDTHDFDACVAALRAGQHPFQRIVLPANEVEGESFIRQIFLQDPDGHYIEICDCQKIEKFVHGLEDAAEIIYQEGVKPSAATLAAVTGMMWNGGLDEAEQLERMWRAFKIHAGDDDFIDASDFDDLLRRMGIQAGSADYRELLKAIDKGGDGRISFPEAMKFLAGRLQRSGSSRMDVEQDMRTAFEVYDADGSGTVSLHELRALLYSVGNRLTEEELERAFDVADRDSSGSISFEEFLVVFNQMQSVAVSVAAEEDDAAGAAGVVSPADVGIIKFRNPMQDLGGAVGVDPFNEHLDERTHIDVESCEGVFMDEAWRAMTVSSPPPQRPTTGTLRTRVLSLLERPSAPLAPTSVSDTKAQDGFRHERWRLQSEPGDHGVVPVLLVGPPKRSKVPLPVVVVLHGTHGSKDDMLPHLQRYAGLGFLACAIDSRYLGERGGDDAYVEALLAAFHSNRTTKNAKKRKPKKKGGGAAQRPFMYDTVWDLMRLADWLESRPDVDASRIGITGVSLGGMHAWLAAAADERFAACAPLIGVQGYRWAIDNEQWHGRVGSIKPVFDSIAEHYGRDIDSEMVADVWAALCPGLVHDDQAMDAPSTLRLIAPRPLLVVNGESDPRCPAQGVREALATALPEWADAGQGDQVQLYFERNGGHAVTAGMWAKVDAFFARQLSPTAKGKR